MEIQNVNAGAQKQCVLIRLASGDMRIFSGRSNGIPGARHVMGELEEWMEGMGDPRIFISERRRADKTRAPVAWRSGAFF